jgi:hypothetical protein
LESEVVFLVEGGGARESVLATLDDPVMSTALAPWLPLFDGPLHRAYEAFMGALSFHPPFRLRA